MTKDMYHAPFEQKEVCSRFMAKLNELRLANTFCDIVLMVNGVSMSAHKVVLSAASDFFKTVFQADTASVVYQINGIESTAMEMVLTFIYTGHVDIQKHLNLMKAVGDQLRIKALVDLCKKYEHTYTTGRSKRGRKPKYPKETIEQKVVNTDSGEVLVVINPKKEKDEPSACAVTGEKTVQLTTGPEGELVELQGDEKSLFLNIISDGTTGDGTPIMISDVRGGEQSLPVEILDQVIVKKEPDSKTESARFHDYCGKGEGVTEEEETMMEVTEETAVQEDFDDENEEDYLEEQESPRRRGAITRRMNKLRSCPWCTDDDVKPAIYNKATLLEHAKEKHPQSLYSCVICERRFLTKDKCVAHTVRCHIGEPVNGEYKCPVCLGEAERYSTDLHAMIVHYKHVHLQQIVGTKCQRCGQECSTHLDFLDHDLNMHDGSNVPSDVRIFKCAHCNFNTVVYDKINRFHRCKKGPYTPRATSEELSCVICSKKFQHRTSLRKHIKIQHTNTEPVSKCTLCNFTSKYDKGLVYHMYKIHRVVSVDTKVYFCPYCDYSNTNLPDLRKHERYKHSDDKPYVCDYCQMRFKNRAHLKNHERIHTGDKPFACDECTYASRTQTDLVRHKRRKHSNEYRYFCECGYKSKVNTNMWFHKKRCQRASVAATTMVNVDPNQSVVTTVGAVGEENVIALGPETEIVLQQAATQVLTEQDFAVDARTSLPYFQTVVCSSADA